MNNNNQNNQYNRIPLPQGQPPHPYQSSNPSIPYPHPPIPSTMNNHHIQSNPKSSQHKVIDNLKDKQQFNPTNQINYEKIGYDRNRYGGSNQDQHHMMAYQHYQGYYPSYQNTYINPNQIQYYHHQNYHHATPTYNYNDVNFKQNTTFYQNRQHYNETTGFNNNKSSYNSNHYPHLTQINDKKIQTNISSSPIQKQKNVRNHPSNVKQSYERRSYSDYSFKQKDNNNNNNSRQKYYNNSSPYKQDNNRNNREDNNIRYNYHNNNNNNNNKIDYNHQSSKNNIITNTTKSNDFKYSKDHKQYQKSSTSYYNNTKKLQKVNFNKDDEKQLETPPNIQEQSLCSNSLSQSYQQQEEIYFKRKIIKKKDPIVDSKQQIKKWLQARKRNYPKRNIKPEQIREKSQKLELSLLQKKIRKKISLINCDNKSIMKKMKDIDILRRFILYPRVNNRRNHQNNHQNYQYNNQNNQNNHQNDQNNNQNKQIKDQVQYKLITDKSKLPEQIREVQTIPNPIQQIAIQTIKLNKKEQQEEDDDIIIDNNKVIQQVYPEEQQIEEQPRQIPINQNKTTINQIVKQIKYQNSNYQRYQRQQLTVDIIIKHLQVKQGQDIKLLQNLLDYKSNSFNYRYQHNALQTNMLLQDIFKDSSYILQVIRYIIKNNFFQNYNCSGNINGKQQKQKEIKNQNIE